MQSNTLQGDKSLNLDMLKMFADQKLKITYDSN